MSKLDRVGYYDLETGEELSTKIVKSIESEEYKNKILEVKYKFENDPYNMTLEEIELYRKTYKNHKRDILQFKSGTFFTASKIDDNLAKDISLETLGVLFRVSGFMNKHGILLYSNNKPINSFEKLRIKLEIGNTKWNRLKKEIDEFSLITKSRTRENRSVLVVNPFYTYTSTEIGEIRFIAYGDLFKRILDLDDYLLLCKKFDIIPEFPKE